MVYSGVSTGFSLVNILSIFLVSYAFTTIGLYGAGTKRFLRSAQLISRKKGWLIMSEASVAEVDPSLFT